MFLNVWHPLLMICCISVFTCLLFIKTGGYCNVSLCQGSGRSSPFLFHSTKSNLKAGHVVSWFSALGRSSIIIHWAVFQQPVPSPSYFLTSHDPPSAAETGGKVAELCRLNTRLNRQHSIHKYSYASKHIPLLLCWKHTVCFGYRKISICSFSIFQTMSYIN